MDDEPLSSQEVANATCMTRILDDAGVDDVSVTFVSEAGAYLLQVYTGETYPTNDGSEVERELRVIAGRFAEEFHSELFQNAPRGPDDYARLYENFGNPQYSRLKDITRGRAMHFEQQERGTVESVYPEATNQLFRLRDWLFVVSVHQSTSGDVPIDSIDAALRIIEGGEDKCPR
ncbi:hypothetical protein [Aurantiacibacter sp. MUD61]|uniref:hypothetical protein n=1 Tax=Aurantiacibacter sp. MUD61 TaxID=3009083 RepID=UPI0022EFFC15|nr:hypothetical protein [Aurantiacibacter sp. MUD61]